MKEEENYIEDYIITALLRLMEEKPYESITVTDIAKKAGVVRVTYYRHFNSKEDILIKYFEKNVKDFKRKMDFRPSTKEDHYEFIFMTFSMFKKYKKVFKLLCDAHLEYIYLDYLNKNFRSDYRFDMNGKTKYDAYFIVGALYNVSMEWLKNDCSDSVKMVADTFFKKLYFEWIDFIKAIPAWSDSYPLFIFICQLNLLLIDIFCCLMLYSAMQHSLD